MSFTAAALPHTGWEQLSTWLERLGGNIAPMENVQADSQQRALLLYSEPQTALANAMSAGEKPTAAAQTWLESARAMVEHFRHNRKNTLVIAVNTLANEPVQTAERITSAWSLPQPENLPAIGQPPHNEPEFQSLAAHMVAADTELTDMARRLEACALPPENPSPKTGLDADAAYERLKTLQNQPELQRAVTRLESEKATLERQLAPLKANAQEQAEALRDSQKAKSHLEEENQLLLEQLHIVQEELEKRFNENLQTTEKLKQKQHQLQKQQRHADTEIHASVLALAAAHHRAAGLENELRAVSASKVRKVALKLTGYRDKNREARKRTLAANRDLVEQSGLFDTNWYLETYPDVAEAGMDPIEHYLKLGALEGRNPSESFSTAWYLTKYRDVATSGLNPLVHYIRHGRDEQRSPCPGSDGTELPPTAPSTVRG
ncbi:MAG: hypothetical protein HLX50_00915 [Alteromonadaceae bacterium]|nr:hypothetical protein [Alteromonadaceae bacterium]